MSTQLFAIVLAIVQKTLAIVMNPVIRLRPVLLLKLYRGDPLLMRLSLPRIPLTQFLAYVRATGGFCVSRGPLYNVEGPLLAQKSPTCPCRLYSPTNTNFAQDGDPL